MTFNSELAETVIRKVIDDPDSHEQANWFCGTTACIAGHIVREAQKAGIIGRAVYGGVGGVGETACNALGVTDWRVRWDLYHTVFFCCNNSEAIINFKHFTDTHRGDANE